MDQTEQDPAKLAGELAVLQNKTLAFRAAVSSLEDQLYQSAIARATPEQKGSRKYRRALRANVKRHVRRNLSK